jgi:hypothetical protein
MVNRVALWKLGNTSGHSCMARKLLCVEALRVCDRAADILDRY